MGASAVAGKGCMLMSQEAEKRQEIQQDYKPQSRSISDLFPAAKPNLFPQLPEAVLPIRGQMFKHTHI